MLFLCPELLPYYVNLGNIYREAGYLSEAGACYEAGLSLCKAFPIDAPLSKAALHMNYAKLCIRQGRRQAALTSANLAMDILKRERGIAPTWTASLLESFAILSAQEGRHEDELSYAEKAISIYETVLGKEHPRTAVSYNNKACALMALGRLSEARECLEKARSALETIVPSNHQFFRKTLQNLSRLGLAQK